MAKKNNKSNKVNKEVTSNIKEKEIKEEKKSTEAKDKKVENKQTSKESAIKEKKTNKTEVAKAEGTKTKKTSTLEKEIKIEKEKKDKADLTKKEESKQKSEKKKKQSEVEEKVEEKTEEKNKEEVKEVAKKEEIRKENIVEDSKKTDEEKNSKKPEYVEDEEKKRKKRWHLFVVFLCVLIILAIFSTIFAFLNINSNTITKGVNIKGIDVSGLTEEEAKNKLENALNIELNATLNMNYKDFTTTLNTNQIEFQYKINEAVTDAYEVGRNKSLIENNYILLKTALMGTDIDIKSSYTEESLFYIINDVASNVPGVVEQPSYYKEGSDLIIEKGKDGIAVDIDKLKSLILEDIKTRKADEIKNNNSVRSITIPVYNKKADSIDIEKIYNEVKSEPKDAYYVENPFQIFKEEDGVDFAISIDEAKKIVSEDKDEYTIPLKLTPASKTINDIGTEAFPYLISDFSTRYDATNTNRTQNLKIAAGKINGTVLMPGETFSFNQIVGKRTVQEGYKDAKIYENGKVVDGLAGGICQISSTLYNAVLRANLEIVERYNHSYTSSYVPAGRDATVVYGVKDFQFKNTRNYPVKIEATVGSGIATFKIHGIKEETEYEVKIIPVTTATIPYSTQSTVDYSLAPGQTVVDQAGHGGCKVTTYKQIWLNGTMVSSQILSNDTYNAMQTIVRVGPAAEASAETPAETP